MMVPLPFPDAQSVNGCTLHTVRVRSDRANTPRLIFVNSLGCDLRIWSGVAQALNGAADMLLYDKRGHGLSDTGSPPYTMRDHAADLIALIESGTGPAHICGLSIGGMIAMVAALERPDLIRSLILCATAARIGTAARYAARETAIHAGGMDAFADQQMDRWFSAVFRRARPEAVEVMRAMLVRQPVEGYLGSVAALRDTDLSAEVGAISVPTFCIVGREDASTPPETLRALADAIPGARYTEIAGAGHLPPIEAPDALAAEIAAICEERV
ncbi:MAG: 3-oxoadipate enol-lactonase [Pseudomonadota bacterium]